MLKQQRKQHKNAARNHAVKKIHTRKPVLKQSTNLTHHTAVATTHKIAPRIAPTFTTRQQPISTLSKSIFSPFSISLHHRSQFKPAFPAPMVPMKLKNQELLSTMKRFMSIEPDIVTITYIESNGDVVPLKIRKSDYENDSLMTLAIKNHVDMEASCDGQLACSTCHCILSQEVYDELVKLKPISEEEFDMLDTAFNLTSTSRLSCQIPVKLVNKDITLTLP